MGFLSDNKKNNYGFFRRYGGSLCRYLLLDRDRNIWWRWWRLA